GVYHALIVELIVLPSYQGQGISSFVLTELVTKCKSAGIQQIQLFCAHGKTSFYLKHGFVARSENAPGMELITTNHESKIKI
ncbi:MAG: GNAT family N-acetyltransferase, partial [Anaerolineales bacterium]|nr:GNAT family N-acetyltransferase [Anaerolineales bacterium]